MKGILLVTHGDFASHLKESAELITGPIAKCKAIGLQRDDDITDLKQKIDDALDEFGTDDGVIVLTDLFGGSPCNMSTLSLKQRKNFKLVTGLNMIMLIETAMMRDELTLEELSKHAVESGIAGVKEIEG